MHLLLESWRGPYSQTGRPRVNPCKLAGLLALAAVNAAAWLLSVTAVCHIVGISPGIVFLIGLGVVVFAASFVGVAILMATRLPSNDC
jgi:hypothetical protein